MPGHWSDPAQLWVTNLVFAGERCLRQLVGAVVGGPHLGPNQADQSCNSGIMVGNRVGSF